jgi:hypothetical protein
MIIKNPAIVLKNNEGKTFYPEYIKVQVAVFVKNVKRWHTHLTLDNHKVKMVEEARQYIPKKFEIAAVEVRPNIKHRPGEPLAQIQFISRIKGE